MIFMYQSKSEGWEIVAPKEYDSGNGKPRMFFPSDIDLRRGEPIKIDEILSAYIEQRWADFIKGRTPVPHNGGLVRVSQMPFVNDSGKLEIHLAQTDYKSHIATCFPIDDYSRNLPFAKQSNGLNSIAVPITIDGFLVCPVRGKTATFQGTLSGFGRSLDSAQTILEKGPSYLYEQVRDSVWKETGIASLDNNEHIKGEIEMQLGGIAYFENSFNRGFNIPLWIARIPLEKGQMQEIAPKAKTIGKKYTGIEFVPISQDSFNQFLKRKDLTASVKPIWVYLALLTFGKDYPIPE